MSDQPAKEEEYRAQGDDELSDEGVALGLSEEPNTFEPEEDPDAVVPDEEREVDLDERPDAP